MESVHQNFRFPFHVILLVFFGFAMIPSTVIAVDPESAAAQEAEKKAEQEAEKEAEQEALRQKMIEHCEENLGTDCERAVDTELGAQELETVHMAPPDRIERPIARPRVRAR